MMHKVIFRFEASPIIGAGHAIRSMVLAARFKELNWEVLIATKNETYHFLSFLKKFERIDPEFLLDESYFCDILIIDSYTIDINQENKFRKIAKKIIVIDDLANRKHDCDILIDQTYGRIKSDYQNLVPNHCKVFTGSDFSLIRDEFFQYREKSREKRKNCKKINQILISLGGWDQKGLTKEVLKKVIDTGYNGAIDIITGFIDNLEEDLLTYIKKLPNLINLHVNPDMAKLMYEADFAITAAGSSVWERSCLGLPGVILLTAENQSIIYKNLIDANLYYPLESLQRALEIFDMKIKDLFSLCDGEGSKRIMKELSRN